MNNKYTDSMVHLHDYLKNSEVKPASKVARCEFYLGASGAGLYLMNKHNNDLLLQAKSDFCKARRAGFILPDQERKNISPSILNIYANACN